MRRIIAFLFFTLNSTYTFTLMEACLCPAPTALTTVPNQDCPQNIGQIQKVIFQRPGFVFNTTGGSPKPIDTLSSWTPLFTAADGTKVVVTPFLDGGAEITAAEAITEGGGDNTTLDGLEFVIGENNPVFTGTFRNLKAAIIAAIRKLRCEKLVAFFINEFDQIICKTTDANVTNIGIPIFALYMGTPANAGKNQDEKTMLRFGLLAEWRSTMSIITPTTFSPKNDLHP